MHRVCIVLSWIALLMAWALWRDGRRFLTQIQQAIGVVEGRVASLHSDSRDHARLLNDLLLADQQFQQRLHELGQR